MDQSSAPSQRVKFGCFEADLRSAELTKQGRHITLQEQPFRLLAMLLERPGELVTREAVRQKLWPNTIVDFDHGLNKAISKIRDALGDSAEKPRFVETVARRGYRFLADVTAASEQESRSAAPRRPSLVDQGVGSDAGDGQTVGFHASVGRRVLLWVLSAAAVGLLLSSAWVLSYRQHAVANIRSIAVLPLANLSGDRAQEYFADGMTDELIAQLGQISALRVISRTSAMTYKNTRKSLADDEAYLKGRYFWNKRNAAGLKTAIEYFQRAIAADPGYAEAYSGLADAYALAGGWEYGVLAPQEAAPRARDAASRAVFLNPALSEAHTSLAFALDISTWDWSGAEREFRRALDLNPGYATAHHWYGYHLMMVGRDDEGIAELKRAESLDPLSLIIGAGVADVLFIAHRFDEAMRQLQKTLEMDPNFAMAHYQRGQVLVQQHKLDAAISEFRQAIELAGHSPAFDANLANAYAASGRTTDARRTAADLEHLPEQSGSLDANIAMIYVGLGDTEQAMQWLEKAYQARFEAIMLVRPQFDPLRADPKFQALVGRLGLGN